MTRPAEYTSPATVGILNANVPGAGSKKTWIIINLFGGADSHNLVIPRTGNPQLPFYEAARGPGVRIEQNEVLALNGESDWGLHPLMGVFRDQWDAGDLAITFDVGTLNEPTTLAQFLADRERYTPRSIGAHDVQQKTWAEALKFRDSTYNGTGVAGRASALVNGIYNLRPNDVTFSLVSAGARRQLTTDTFSPDAAALLPIFNQVNPANFGAGEAANTLRAKFRQLPDNSFGVNPAEANLIRQAMVYGYNSDFATPPFVNANFLNLPSGAINNAMSGAGDNDGFRIAARALYTMRENAALGCNRQIIFISGSMGGAWDHHGDLLANLQQRIPPLMTGCQRLRNAIDAMGAQDDVVVSTITEFGRTFVGNTNAGTDHAWSGHMLTFGGPVIGGLYGGTPDYDWINGQWTTIGTAVGSAQGVFLPQRSTEQYYSTFLRWWGIPSSLMDLVLPAASLYSNAPGGLDLGFLPAP